MKKTKAREKEKEKEKKFACAVYFKKIARNYNVTLHMRTQHTTRVFKVVCSVKKCGELYSNKENLQVHLRKHHRFSTSTCAPVNSITYQCHYETMRSPLGVASEYTNKFDISYSQHFYTCYIEQ